MRNNSISPELDFSINQNKQGTVEYCLKSLIEQSEEADQDRSSITQTLAEEKKIKLENYLQKLIHQAATRMGVYQDMELQVNLDLNKDLLWILRDEDCSSFNMNLLLKDIQSTLKDKHSQKNECEILRNKIVSKIKEPTGQKQGNKFSMELSDLVQQASKGSLEISGGNEKAKTLLTK